jgi:Lrp/AsnC family leucine-responsive transcriptional regulator
MYITEYKFEREGVLHPKPKQEIPAPIVSFGGKKEAKLDKTDIIILQELAKNCRIKNVDLAKKASISEDIVRLRIKRMEKEKIIFGYGITINLASIGLEPYLVELQIEQITKETLAKLQTYVHSNPYIIYCARTIGKYNVILNIHAKNAEHFNEIMLEIRNQFGTLLNNYEFQLEIKEMKEIYVPEGFLTT